MAMQSSPSSGNPPVNRRAQGRLAEDRVAAWLVEQGYRIVAQSYYARPGEIDIIATKGLIYAFVEVKSRTREYVDQGQAITPAKQRALVRAARTFATLHQLNYTAVLRFDVAFVGAPPLYNITYIQNAFSAPDSPY